MPLLELLELLELDELLELLEPLELLELLEVPTWQLAVKSALTTHVKPSGHPHTVQSPGWH